jgi:hypothetical protein
MPSLGLSLPTLPEFDRNEEKAEQRWQHVQRRIDWETVEERFVELVGDALTRRAHPLRTLVDTLKDAPVIDTFDVDGWVASARIRDLEALGKSMMRLLGEAQLVGCLGSWHKTMRPRSRRPYAQDTRAERVVLCHLSGVRGGAGASAPAAAYALPPVDELPTGDPARAAHAITTNHSWGQGAPGHLSVAEVDVLIAILAA